MSAYWGAFAGAFAALIVIFIFSALSVGGDN